MDKIDKIFYINLDHRTDRNESMINELTRLDILDKAERINAIKNKNVKIGCTKSHIYCLEEAIRRNYNNILILEDDMRWSVDKEQLNMKVNNFFNNIKEWDVVFFCGCINHATFVCDGVARAKQVYTSTSYMVNKNYMKTLKDNFYDCMDDSPDKMNQPDKFAHDLYWFPLQKKDNWYIITPQMGYQYANISNGAEKAFFANDEIYFKNYFTFKLDNDFGNRLFQIAYGISLMKKLGFQFYLRDNSFLYNDKLLKLIPKLQIATNNTVIEDPKYFSTQAFIDFPMSAYYQYEFQGFFQNEKYYSIYKDQIIDLMTPTVDDKILRKYPYLDSSYFIHILRKNDVDLEYYYKRCVSLLGSEQHFYIFSDDLTWCQNNLSFIKNKTAVMENDILTLYLMSKCNLGGVCSNSSIAWWGSYLNKNKDKKVYFPNKWTKKDYIVDIYPSYANIINVKEEVNLDNKIIDVVYCFSDKICYSVDTKIIKNHNQVLNNNKCVMVIENDLIFHKDWINIMNNCLKELNNKEWDLFLLNAMGHIEWQTQGLRKANNMYLTGCYILSKSGIEKISKLRHLSINDRLLWLQNQDNSYFHFPFLVIKQNNDVYSWIKDNYMPNYKHLYLF